MRPAPFQYVAPSSAEEALALIAQYGEDARFLAGGQSLIPLMNLRMARPSVLIDLGGCADLDYLDCDETHVISGAMTRQGTAERDAGVRRDCPLLAAALGYMGRTTIRNLGTIGGSLAHADPAAELPAVASALDAEFVVDGPRGQRTLRSEAFFIAELTTAVEADEMLREIRIPRAHPRGRSAFVELGNHRGGLAIVAIAAYLEIGGTGSCDAARLAAVGAGPRPIRLSGTEAVLRGQVLSDDIIGEAAAACAGDIDPLNDVHASAEDRRHFTIALAERALRQVWAQQPEERSHGG